MLVHPKILKLARLALDLTQDEVADLAGVSVRILQKLESCDQDTTVRSIRLVTWALQSRGVKFLGDSDTLGSGFRVPVEYLQGTWNEREPDGRKQGKSHS